MMIVMPMSTHVGFVVDDGGMDGMMRMMMVGSGPAASEGHVHTHQGWWIVAVVVIERKRQRQSRSVMLMVVSAASAATGGGGCCSSR